MNRMWDLRSGEDSIMTQGFCPEQGKDEITTDMQRLWKKQTWKGKIGTQV